MDRTRSPEPSPLPDRTTPNTDYQLLFRSNPQPMWVFDRESLRFLTVNDAAVAAYGYGADEFLGMTILDIRPPEDRGVVRSIVDTLPEEGLGSPGCWRHRTKDGRVIEVELSTQSVRFEGAAAVMVLAIDVTAQVEAQRKAKLHERALRELNEALIQEHAWLLRSQEVARIGAWETDLKTLKVIWSVETFRLFNLDPGSFVPTHATFLEFVHPEDREAVDAAFRASYDSREAQTIRHRILPRGGGERFVEERWHTERDDAGDPVRAYGTCQDITERRAAEVALRASEMRFRTVFETAATGIIITSTEGVFVEVNPAFCAMLGRPVEEVRGVTFVSLTHPDDVAGNVEAHRLVMSGERPGLVLEKRYLHKDGSTVWCRLSIATHRDADDSAIGVIAIAEDITAQRAAREALLMSEERFRLLARATNDAIWDWDLRTNALWWNEGYELLFGYDRAQVLPNISAWNTRVHPEDAARVVGGVHEAIDSGADQWSDEYRFRRADGSYAYVLDRGHIIRQGEKAIRMIGGMTDLTQRRDAEERLAEQAALLDTAREPIAVKDLEGRFVYWNKGAERTYGWTAAEVAGRKSPDFFALDPEIYAEGWRQLLEHGTWEGELRRRTKDGAERIVEVRWTLVRRADGTPRAVFAIDTDVTERRRIAAQSLRAQRLESLGTLAGGIAHDLNNVLTPILASIGFLREPLSEDDRRETLEAMEEAAQRGAAMVRQVLTFARGAEGRRERIAPRVVAEQITKIIRETFPKSILLRFDAAPELLPITADPTQLHQVLLNLCVNARDAMPAGGTLTLQLANATLDEQAVAPHPDVQPGTFVRMSVIDDGSGIPPEILEHLFEPFFTTKELGQGTGLGLSTVHSIVRSHGGFITLSSTLGRGTRFDIFLPAEEGAPVPEAAVAVADQHPRGSGELILVVDDEETIRRVIRRTLERFGYRVLEAQHGVDGVSQFGRHRREIAAIITDVSMPVMDGPAMISAILALDPKARIIASSGLAEDREVASAAGHGTLAVVPKPYTAEALLTTLHRVLHPPG
jgi:PAS domain S-box-containing protein